jgi:predicted metalloprotease with PDZ domain
LTVGLLDIKLLELSHGERGLRELIAELTKRYGKHHAFPEDSLFTVIERLTSPDVGEFFARYVRESEHLPIKEYYAKLGIRLIQDERGMPLRFEIDPNPSPEQQRLRMAWLGRPNTS